MTPRAVRRFALAAVIFVLAGWIGFGGGADRLDKPGAAAVARHLLAAYRTETGEPARHFAATGAIDYPDGWEFGWSYAPCPEIARLRVFVGRNGRAEYAETPDCDPAAGFSAPLTKV